jgi:hypothetical protein
MAISLRSEWNPSRQADGHYRKSKDALPSSAFPSTADIAAQGRHVRKLPKTDVEGF